MPYLETRAPIGTVGTAAAGTTSATAYPLPTGAPYGSRFILQVEGTTTKTITNQNGGTWTLVGSFSVTGSAITVFEAKYVAGMGNPTCSADADHQTGRIYSYSGSLNDPDVVCSA